jgi:hypothetical protein
VCTVTSRSVENNTGHIDLVSELTEVGCALSILVPQCTASFWCQQPEAGLQ